MMLICVALVMTFLVGCSDHSSRSVVDPTPKQHTNAFKDLLTAYLAQTLYGPAPDWDRNFALPQSEMTQELQSLIGRVYFLMESELRDGAVKRRRRSHTSVFRLLAGLRLRVQAIVHNSDELRKDSEVLLRKVDTSSTSRDGGLATDKMIRLCSKNSKTPSDCKVSVLKTLIASYMLYPLCMRKLPPSMGHEARVHTCRRMGMDFQFLEYSDDEQYNQLLAQAFRDRTELDHLIIDEPRSVEGDRRIMKLAGSPLHIPEIKNWQTWPMPDREKLFHSQAQLSIQP